MICPKCNIDDTCGCDCLSEEIMSDKPELKPCQNTMCALHGNKGNKCLYWGDDADVESCCCYTADLANPSEVYDRIQGYIRVIQEKDALLADLAKPSESPMDDIGPCNFVLDCTRSSEACSYLLLAQPRCFKPSPPTRETP